MAFEPKDNSGALFIKKDKKSSSKRPDYSGYLLIDGARIQLAAWSRTSKSGSQYLTLRIDEKHPADDAEADEESGE